MSSFIDDTLIMLEDVGISIRYPEIRSVVLMEDGRSETCMRSSVLSGVRVSIEQNPKIKFMMIFSLLDFYVDSSYPNMEGKSYKRKYESLPVHGDFELIFRQLFRIAKVIRNTLVHNPSSFSINDSCLNTSYNYKKTNFSVIITLEALRDYYTAVIMYLKGDMGKGSYFLGIIRSIYRNVLAGIRGFSDEFGDSLETPSMGVELKPRIRNVFVNPSHEMNEGRVKITTPERELPEWEGMDFYISHRGDDFLIPREALDSALSISEHDLVSNWKRQGRFPPIGKP